MGFLKPVVITFLSIAILAWLLPTISYFNIVTLIIASIVLTLLNEIVKPVLKILFLPINVITLGLFAWVINVLILWLALIIVPGLHIDQMNLFGYHLGWFMTLLVISFGLGVIRSLIEIVF